MNEYPEVIFTVSLLILVFMGFLALALIEYIKKGGILFKNNISEDIKKQEIGDNSNKDNSGNEDMVPQSGTSIGLNMTEFPQMESDANKKKE